MKKVLFVLMLVLFYCTQSRAQQIPSPSTNVSTQQLTLLPQVPLAQVTTVQEAPSIQGPTTYYYWFVSHQGGVTSPPAGPFPVYNAPATLGGINTVTVTWNLAPGVTSYDVLRTTTTAVPSGACGCAVAIGTPSATIVDNTPTASLSAYTVNTSASQIPAICTNTTGCGSGAGPGVLNSNVVYLSTNCGVVANCFQVKDNGVQQVGCSWIINQNTVTCPTGTFSLGMLNARIAGYHTCTTDSAGYAVELGASGTTITGFTDSGHVTVSTNATVTDATGCMMAAAIDDTPISQAEAAWDAAPNCPTVSLPAGIMGTMEPHFHTSPASCNANGLSLGKSDNGQLAVVEGQGMGVTQLWWPPDFDIAACTNGTSGKACMTILNSTVFRAFSVTGAGLPSLDAGSVKYVIEGGGGVSGFGYLDRFSCQNIGVLTPPLTGNGTLSHLVALHPLSFQIYIFDSDIDGCGAEVSDGQGGGSIYAQNSQLGDGGSQDIFLDTNFNSLGKVHIVGDVNQAANVHAFQGGNVFLTTGDFIDTNGAPSSLVCYNAGFTNGQSFSVNPGAFCNGSGGVNLFHVTTVDLTNFSDPSGGLQTSGSSAVTYNDRGGNSFSFISLANGSITNTLQVAQSGIVTPGDVATWNARGVLQDGGTPNTAIQSNAVVTLVSDVALTSGTPATILTKSVTMPASGCPCRVLVSYEAYATTNNQTFNAWVSDGTNFMASTQTTGVGTNTTGLFASQISPVTYANSAVVTFTLTAEDNGTGGTIKAAPIQGSGTNSWMSTSVVTSQ